MTASQRTWIVPRNVVADWASDSSIYRELGRSQLIEIVHAGQPGYPGVRGLRALSLKSLRSIRAALNPQRTSPGVPAIIYDNEHWPATPHLEALSPITYESRAAEFVKARGLLFISTPGLDLAALRRSRSAALWRQFLQTGWIGASAKLADVLEIQSQSYERDPAIYAEFVTLAVRQARAANPKVIVIAGLTSTKGFSSTLAREVISCVKLTAQSVSGYFLNVPQPALAQAVLRIAAETRRG